MVDLPVLASGDEISVSASSYVLWRQCPQQALARFSGVYGADSLPAFRGSLAHAIFARHLGDGPIAPESFDVACKQAIGGSNLNFKVKSLNLKPSMVQGVIEEVGGLYDRFKLMPTDGFEGAERLVKAHLGGDVSVVGRIDAVYRDADGVRLVDWKTGNLGDVELQLTFYALLWMLETDEIPDQIEAYSVQTGEHERYTPTEADVQSLLDDVVQMVADVRSAWASGEELERRAGPWCQYCPLFEDCGEGKASQRYL